MIRSIGGLGRLWGVAAGLAPRPQWNGKCAMKKKFVILHLSDAHIGKSFEGVDEAEVLDPLYIDIAAVHKDQKLTPDLVVFSGDVVQGCFPACEHRWCLKDQVGADCVLEKQYKRADAFVKKVLLSAGGKLGKTPFVIVPGNHDVNRNLVSGSQRAARKAYDASLVDEIQTNRNNDWPEIIKRHKRWFQFARGLRNARGIHWDERFCTPWAIIKHGGTSIGVVGFNTSWCACEKDQLQLWIGDHQFKSLYQKVKGAEVKIVVAHHPCTWLNGREAVEKSHKVESSFNIFFHGHEHSGWFSDGAGHLRVEGGAAYAHSKDRNAYSWVEVDFETRSARIYARTFSNEGRGGWIPANVPDKIINGIGEVRALFVNGGKGTPARRRGRGSGAKMRAVARRTGWVPGSTLSLIDKLAQDYKVRWERQLYDDARKKQVFWPVRLRLNAF